jgi:hypothetical protein
LARGIGEKRHKTGVTCKGKVHPITGHEPSGGAEV